MAAVSDEDQTLLYDRIVPLLESDAPRKRDAMRALGRQHRAAVESPISITKTGSVNRGQPATVTPTALLPNAINGAASVIDVVDHTERLPQAAFDSKPRPPPSPPAARPSPNREPMYATSTSSGSPVEEPAAEPKPTTPRKRAAQHAAAARVFTALMIAAAIFAAAIATALVIQRAPKPRTPSETRP